MQYSGQFRVARGDFFHPSLADTNSIDFQDKAERYQKMVSPHRSLLLRELSGSFQSYYVRGGTNGRLPMVLRVQVYYLLLLCYQGQGRQTS